ncbi:MAG: peptide deformylase [Phycisphaerales bacterium]|nr:peptide deformylase [Phycisphaerales bacterium]
MSVDPAKLQIVHYPSPVLRQKAKPVDTITQEVRAVATRMLELMFEARGIGLAAPQVGLPWRMFVVHVPATDEDDDPDEPPRSPDHVPPTATATPQIYINPKLTGFSRDLVAQSEGCLSIPGITGEVRRPSSVTITALDLQGESITQQATGLLARCWQHEFDHIEGVLCIDKFLPPDKRRAAKHLQAMEEAAGHLGTAARG